MDGFQTDPLLRLLSHSASVSLWCNIRVGGLDLSGRFTDFLSYKLLKLFKSSSLILNQWKAEY